MTGAMRMADLVFWADIILTILVPAISHERAQGMRIIITINVPVKKRSLKMRFLKFVGHCQIEEVGTSVPRGGRARVLSRGGTQSLPPINAFCLRGKIPSRAAVTWYSRQSHWRGGCSSGESINLYCSVRLLQIL
jgi:hypothetical protein